MALNNEEEVLSDAALQQRDKTVIDFDFIERIASLVLRVIGFFIKRGPGKAYYVYHRREVEILLDLILDFKGLEPIDNGIERLEKNLDNYILETQRLVQTEKDIPASPWPNESVVLIFLIPILKANPQFIKSYNEHLDNYQQQMQKAIEYANDIKEEGENLERSVPQNISQIAEEIDKAPSSKFSDVVKQRLRLRLDLIRIRMTDVSHARGSVDDIIKKLQERKNKAANADRL
jgi:uncharacterized protein YdaT